jgi:signal transduction histidine kinase
MANKKRVDIKINTPKGRERRESEYILRGEKSLLENMFSNLIKNAIEASPEGKSVSVGIEIEEKGDSRYLIVDIHNLSTVPDEIRDKFFEPYVTSKKKGGTGLGTHSAMLVVEAHQGDIRFNTSREGGTHVIVKLPEVIGKVA